MAASDPVHVRIQRATSEDLSLVRELFLEYAKWLNVDLSFQDFEHELASLPGAYAPPDGDILIAWPTRNDSESAVSRDAAAPSQRREAAVGCVAVRRFDGQMCEMKRLWVRPEYRGHGVGRALVQEIITRAREAGYGEMVLDTLRTMAPAYRLYTSCGFSEIEAYYHNPLPGAVYLGCEL